MAFWHAGRKAALPWWLFINVVGCTRPPPADSRLGLSCFLPFLTQLAVIVQCIFIFMIVGRRPITLDYVIKRKEHARPGDGRCFERLAKQRQGWGRAAASDFDYLFPPTDPKGSDLILQEQNGG
jgi:hypothetical protein